MPSIETSKRALRVTSDSMYDPANPHDSFMAGDKVIVDPDRVPEEGDFVIVSYDGNEYLMQLINDGGVRTFRYMAPDRAAFRLTDASAIITGVVAQRHRLYASMLSGPLKWQGDDIGLCSDSSILVNLADQYGHTHATCLRDALLAADQIDEYGLQRITSALSFAAEQGCLRSMDLDVWNEFKGDRMLGGKRGGDIYNVAKKGATEVQLAASRGVQS